MEQFTNKRM